MTSLVSYSRIGLTALTLLFCRGLFAQNVGIGQSNPIAKLDINGNLVVGAAYSGVSAAPANGALFQGAVGIGTSSPASTLHLYKTTNSGHGIIIDAQGTQNVQHGYIEFTTLGDGTKGLGNASTLGWQLTARGNTYSMTSLQNDFLFYYWDGSAWNTRMALLHTGNVGIGQPGPKAKLDVSGNLMVGASYSGTASAPANGALIQGKVGIGTSTVTAMLEINNGGTDNCAVRGLSGNAANWAVYQVGRTAGEGSWAVSAGVDQWCKNSVAGDIVLRTESTSSKLLLATDPLTTVGLAIANSNVGIGCVSPAYKLHVNGNMGVNGTIVASGTITASTGVTACSDARFKRDIAPLQGCLERVGQLRGVEYHFRTEAFPDRSFGAGRQIGFIAQEVERVFPEFVFTDDKGYKSVDYSRLTPVLVEAVKELRGQNQALEARNQTLDHKNQELEARLARVEQQIQRLSN